LFLTDGKVDNFGMLTCRAELGYYSIYYATMFNGLKAQPENVQGTII
jgi:hypothetical protein